MHWGCVIWVNFVKNPEQTFESQLNVINPALFSDEARCFSQSERGGYMETFL